MLLFFLSLQISIDSNICSYCTIFSTAYSQHT